MNDSRHAEARAALKGDDKEAFEAAIAPHLDTLTAAARRDLQYYRRQGSIRAEDFSPEEIVGEGLIHAWDRRDRFPDRMSPRGWLLAVQHRALRGLVARQRRLNQEQIISLDAPVPTEGSSSDDTQEWFWEWYQPDQVNTWEEITPGSEPVDTDLPVEGDYLDTLDEDQRHVAVLHHEFEMPMEEVAFALGRSLNEMAEQLNGARTTLRERLNRDGVNLEGRASPYGDPDRAG